MLLMGKSTISMAIFHSKLLVHQRVLGDVDEHSKSLNSQNPYLWASHSTHQILSLKVNLHTFCCLSFHFAGEHPHF